MTGRPSNFIDQYLGCRREELPPAALERYGERLNFYNGRFWAVLPDDLEHQDYLYKAQYRFDKKLEKLNTSYQRNDTTGFICFCIRRMSAVLTCSVYSNPWDSGKKILHSGLTGFF